MYILASHNWFQDLMRTFFFSIDKIVFNFISTIYDLLMSIARTSVLSQGDIASMAERIYDLLAVFMVFKVTFSLIMYVVNPDDFSDKSKGISKLGINIVFSLAMLILTPYIFNYAYQFQTIILEDNSLATLIFDKSEGNNSINAIQDAGDIISYAALTPFITPNLSLVAECSNLVVKTKTGNVFNESCSGITFDGSKFNEASNITDDTLYKFTKDNDNFDETTLKNYVAGVTYGNLGLTFRQDLILASDSNKKNYIIDYKYIFSTAVGVVIVLLLISFCMDVGLRSIKLAFLQLIAPIPILSYVDPKSGKDGMFKKWYQMCFKTYLSLFLKLLALYFAIYIISRVDNMVDIVDGSYISSSIIKIFIIIGALMFAKNFTKILEGLGIKLDGDGKFTLNPLKKFENEALGGKRFTGAAGAMVSSTVDRAARLATTPGIKRKIGTVLGAAPGLLDAAVRGASTNKGYTGGKTAQNAVNRRLREGRINGLSPMGSYLDYLGSRYGLDDATLEKEGILIREYEDQTSEIKNSIARKTVGYKQSIAREQDKQKTMKATLEARKNVQNQGERLMSVAKDVAEKKGDMGTSYISAADKITLGNFNFSDSEKRAMTKLGIHIPTNINDISSSDFDKLYKEGRKLNYTSNRTANQSNLQKLQAISENGGSLTEDLVIYGKDGNNYTFKAGTSITGDEYALAKSQVGYYEKESLMSVFDALASDDENLSDSVRTGEVVSFKNISDEYMRSVKSAEDTSSAYNKEYSNDSDFVAINETINSTVSSKNVKQNIEDMKNDVSTTAVNNKLRNSNKTIEKLNRQITEIEDNDSNYIDYIDENGQKHHITIKEYDERMKIRKAKYDREKKRHQERRSIFINKN